MLLLLLPAGVPPCHAQSSLALPASSEPRTTQTAATLTTATTAHPGLDRLQPPPEPTEGPTEPPVETSTPADGGHRPVEPPPEPIEGTDKAAQDESAVPTAAGHGAPEAPEAATPSTETTTAPAGGHGQPATTGPTSAPSADGREPPEPAPSPEQFSTGDRARPDQAPPPPSPPVDSNSSSAGAGNRSVPGKRPASILPGMLVQSAILTPAAPQPIKVKVGRAIYMRFSCLGGPADAVISLASPGTNDDAMLFLSLDPDKAPTLDRDGSSSYEQWLEDSPNDRYVIAHGVKRRGGVLGLLNLRHYASEPVDGVLTISCSSLDGTRNSAICPIGRVELSDDERRAVTPPDENINKYCSGHGKCSKHGVCECDANFTGTACESRRIDATVKSSAKYQLSMTTGEYRYFRMHVPNIFPGGFLKIELASEAPLVVVVSSHGVPTKSKYETSNFDDWVNHRNSTTMQIKVRPPLLHAGPLPEASSMEERRPPTSPFSIIGTVPRRGLSDAKSTPMQLPISEDGSCPAFLPPNSHSDPSCSGEPVTRCLRDCMSCIQCTRKADRSDYCTMACQTCTSSAGNSSSQEGSQGGSAGCIEAMASCAKPLSCSGEEMSLCRSKCSNCMGCITSNDPDCSNCRCCDVCLPLAAKCGLLAGGSGKGKYITVGVFNHRWYYNEHDTIEGTLRLSLVVDPGYGRSQQLPVSWLSKLYNPFHDLRSMVIAEQTRAPGGERFIYEMELHGRGHAYRIVRLYSDRMTLLHIAVANERHEAGAMSELVVRLQVGHNVSHVLSSTLARPKTLFDFDQLKLPSGDSSQEDVVAHATGKNGMWCALFGRMDGYVQVEVQRTWYQSQEALLSETLVALALSFAFALGGLCVLLALRMIRGRSAGDLDLPPTDLCVERSPRSGGHMTGRRSAPGDEDSMIALTRGDSFPGFGNLDMKDPNVEERYLRRAGFGDDGI